MSAEFKEIEEIINRIDNIDLEEWNKKEGETQEEFESRIQELEEELEEELIDAISDSLLDEQEINEEETVREVKEKIQKEFEIYQEAFDIDANGKIVLKNREELSKLGYESNEEIEKLKSIADNYNNPELYIENIRNNIRADKDIDEEIDRKLEIAKMYIRAKIRGEEPVITSNATKTKKYEDNNKYISTTKYLRSVPIVQDEMIYNDRLISRSYERYIPNLPEITKNGVVQNVTTTSNVKTRQRTVEINPIKLQMLRNIEKKMDKSNYETKQRIKSRIELKRTFKKFEGKELNDNENDILKQKITEINKKYPGIVNEQILSKLYDTFNIKQPGKNKEPKAEPTEKIEEKAECIKTLGTSTESCGETEAKIKTKKKMGTPKIGVLSIATTLGALTLKGKKRLQDLLTEGREGAKTQELGCLTREVIDINSSEELPGQLIDEEIEEEQKNSDKFEEISMTPVGNYPNMSTVLRTLELGENPDFDIEDLKLWDFSMATKYLESNNDSKNQILFENLIGKIDDFTGKKFISNLTKVNGYFDIMLLEKMYQLYSKGIKKQDGSGYIIEKNIDKAKEYLAKEFSYLEYLKTKAGNRENNPIENIKNEARFNKALNMIGYTSIAKKIDGIMLMAKSEILKRRNDTITYQTCKDLISEYEEKLKDNQTVGLYALETLGNIYYEGIVAKNGSIILEPDKIKAKNIYEEIIKKSPNSKNDIAYNRLLKLYSDNTLPIYDKDKEKSLREIMRQKKIKVSKVENKAVRRNANSKSAYVCSDLHGEWEAYKTIIDRLGENDKLYILGDVIDRGPDGIKILQDIIERQEKGQVEFFLGNHEYMMLQSILGEGTEDELWKYNDKETHEIYEELSQEEKDKMQNFLQNSLIYKQIKEGNQDYYLVHARAVQDADEKSQTYREMKSGRNKAKIFEAVFDRAGDDCNVEDIPKKGIFTITGHTPTTTNGYQIDINNGFIDIDCGISYGENVAMVNLTEGDVEYFSAEKIKEKDQKSQNEVKQEER